MGLLVAIGGFWAIIGPSIFGFISDRVRSKFGRRRPFLLAGAAVTVVGLMVLANAPSYPILILGFLVLQVGDDLAQGPYASLIPELVAKEQRGRASGAMGLLQLVAQVAGAGAGLALADHFKILYLLIAGVHVACAAWTVLTVKERPAEARGRVSLRGFLRGWTLPWRSHDFRWVWGTRFMVALGYYIIAEYLKYYLESWGVTLKLFGIVLGDGDNALRAVIVLAVTIAIFGTVSAVVGGYFADRIGRKRVIYAAGFIMCVAVVPFIFITQYPALVVVSAVFGLGYGAYLSSDWALASDIMPSRDDLGKDMGIWQSSVPFTQVIAGLLGLVVVWGNRLADGMGYRMLFAVAVVSFILGIVFIRKVRGST